MVRQNMMALLTIVAQSHNEETSEDNTTMLYVE